jgi:hypothetical protein
VWPPATSGGRPRSTPTTRRSALALRRQNRKTEEELRDFESTQVQTNHKRVLNLGTSITQKQNIEAFDVAVDNSDQRVMQVLQS